MRKRHVLRPLSRSISKLPSRILKPLCMQLYFQSIDADFGISIDYSILSDPTMRRSSISLDRIPLPSAAQLLVPSQRILHSHPHIEYDDLGLTRFLQPAYSVPQPRLERSIQKETYSQDWTIRCSTSTMYQANSSSSTRGVPSSRATFSSLAATTSEPASSPPAPSPVLQSQEQRSRRLQAGKHKCYHSPQKQQTQGSIIKCQDS